MHMNRKIYTVFENLSTRNQFLLGCIMTLFGWLLAYLLDIRYVGTFKVAPLQAGTPSYVPLLDNLLVVLWTSISLFLMGLLINRRTRFIDILNVVLISRAPFYLVCLFNIKSFMFKQSDLMLKQLRMEGETLEVISIWPMLLMASAQLLLAVITFWLLFAGFHTASNGRGAKLILLFIVGIIIGMLGLSLFLPWFYGHVTLL